MNIVDALREYALKIEYAERRLVIHPDKWFRVYERKLYNRKSTLLCSTLSEDEAVAILTGVKETTP